MTKFPDHFFDRLHALEKRDPFIFPRRSVPDKFRRAAVLLPFWREGDAIKMVCFVRPMSAPTHAGQVAFPGGAEDQGDTSMVHTALRESQEELGIDPASVQVVGQLDDAWSGGGFHVSSFVGWLEEAPHIRPDPHEVEEAVVADVEPLFDPEAMISKPVNQHGRQWVAQEFDLSGARLYGFSANLFVEVMSWVREEPERYGPMRLRELQRWVEMGMPPWQPPVPAREAEEEI